MTSRRATRLAVGIGVLALVLDIAGDTTSWLYTNEGEDDVLGSAIFLAIVVVCCTVGALIASRQPRNAIGWILCGVGLSAGFAIFAHGYADWWLEGNGPNWLGEAAAVWGESSWMPFVIIPATFLLLLFPDGRLPSRRWRWVARAGALGFVCALIGALLIPGPIPDYPSISNPYGNKALSDPLQGIGYLLLLVALIGSPLSLVLRFRRAGVEERQQIKWLALAGAVAATTVILFAVPLYDVVGETVANMAIMTSILGLPVATGIAILRYRLYDIDVVVNRTLVYGALTATLAATYLGGVLLFQLVLGPLTSDSGLAVAASTLAVAALARPARQRIQDAVDRRFYRRRYDARQVLERFGAHLRDEVALESLSSELRGVVAETMQPAHVSLWLRARP